MIILINTLDNNTSVSNFQNYLNRQSSMLREGSFILDERYLPTRGPSQIYPIGNEDIADNLFPRNNQMTNRYLGK